MLSRRDVLKFGVAGLGTLILPRLDAFGSGDGDPRFFLKIFLDHGADHSYLFDARPLAMTEAGLIQNYLGTEPGMWTGTNGVSTRATALTSPLEKFRDRFSILNGVLMATDFPGHPQNQNYLFTGNVFGGESFVPHLNLGETGRAPTALDVIQNGDLQVASSNSAGTAPLKPVSLMSLAAKLLQLAPAAPGDELIDFIRGRMSRIAQGSGTVSNAAALMMSSLALTPDLQAKIMQIKAVDAGLPPERQFVELLAQCFRLSISRSAVWVLPEEFDTHAASQAKNQPQLFTSAVDKIAMVFQTLQALPYDANRSMLDVTTIMVTSEFGRSMRNEQTPVSETGTDHNPLANSVLLGGGGIRGGLVIGGTDFQTASEKLSGAHEALDSHRLRVMGRPFDFKTLAPRNDLPATYDIRDYLTIGSVVNTIYSRFDVAGSRYRTLGRDAMQVAPVLDGILV